MKMKSIRECELTWPNVKHLLFGLRALQTSIKMNYTVIQTDLFKHIFESFWNKWKLQKNNFKNKLEWWEQTKIQHVNKTLVWPHDVESFQGSMFCLFVMAQLWNIGVC
jgi:DNA-binding ferritin-like protein (Dps family)